MQSETKLERPDPLEDVLFRENYARLQEKDPTHPALRAAIIRPNGIYLQPDFFHRYGDDPSSCQEPPVRDRWHDVTTSCLFLSMSKIHGIFEHCQECKFLKLSESHPCGHGWILKFEANVCEYFLALKIANGSW